MKRIICWAKAIPFWIRSGVWCPHIYVEESREPAIIIANDKGFRVAQNYMHYHDETVYPKATLIRSRCECCGKEDLSWIDGEVEVIKTN